MLDLDKIKFDAEGLIPAIVQDCKTKEVLTLAYMNRESLEISLSEGRTCFFSRSRQTLWRKGETSGNVQYIVDVYADCDADALVLLVRPTGPACHTGEQSCFFQRVYSNGEPIRIDFGLAQLYELVKGRKDSPQEKSYTSYLFEKGLDKILKKIGEECAEVIIAGKARDKRETVFELADLSYHLIVLMAEAGITPAEVLSELERRHVLDKKVKQEYMQ
ncbi:MAG: bifunctional phosphoribosyl-AMP cyclohydrolase/phosphoribosyl-ATP diphosphatase HisIE [Oscillospiraceae bacterium]|jgi:phosphoribosyl-ATP pyrophosphohydrolase/phosphoribosyl-AMP cyclohydrolase|nr:bifunctional phosphoribosyl-AMP cyclohydrolase/phosphoribosyl-ATP diphosphatase HisIE [Oscillospiraceae bacterium]